MTRPTRFVRKLAPIFADWEQDYTSAAQMAELGCLAVRFKALSTPQPIRLGWGLQTSTTDLVDSPPVSRQVCKPVPLDPVRHPRRQFAKQNSLTCQDQWAQAVQVTVTQR